MNDIAKCGTMIDFLRESAPSPTMYPIPSVSGRVLVLCVSDICKLVFKAYQCFQYIVLKAVGYHEIHFVQMAEYSNRLM